VVADELASVADNTRYETGTQQVLKWRSCCCWRITKQRGTWSAGGLRICDVRPKSGSRAVQKWARSGPPGRDNVTGRRRADDTLCSPRSWRRGSERKEERSWRVVIGGQLLKSRSGISTCMRLVLLRSGFRMCEEAVRYWVEYCGATTREELQGLVGDRRSIEPTEAGYSSVM
jgi:hypothetical protein